MGQGRQVCEHQGGMSRWWATMASRACWVAYHVRAERFAACQALSTAPATSTSINLGPTPPANVRPSADLRCLVLRRIARGSAAAVFDRPADGHDRHTVGPGRWRCAIPMRAHLGGGSIQATAQNTLPLARYWSPAWNQAHFLSRATIQACL